MALTLAEASKLSNDMLLQGVVETIVKDSPILQHMPFIEIVGNGLTYNQENTLPSIDFYDVGDTWDESTPTFEQKTANLKIMGGDADVDNFLKSTRSNIQDLEAAVIELKAKALRDKFEEIFVYGDSEGSNQFDGLRKLINTESASDQVIAMGATGATLTLAKLDELIDAVKGGKPDMLLITLHSFYNRLNLFFSNRHTKQVLRHNNSKNYFLVGFKFFYIIFNSNMLFYNICFCFSAFIILNPVQNSLIKNIFCYQSYKIFI